MFIFLAITNLIIGCLMYTVPVSMYVDWQIKTSKYYNF